MGFHKFGASDDGRITEVDKPDETLARQASVNSEPARDPDDWSREDEIHLRSEISE